jgi:hypothetical protein
VRKEIADTERYLDLDPHAAVENVVLVVPEDGGNRLVEAARNAHSNLVVWSFNFDIDKRTLKFNSLYNDLSTKSYSWLTTQSIVFPFAWCSLRRFLRDEPPVVYTAGILWNIVLRSFFDHGLSFEGPFDLEFSDVVDVAKRFYPGGPDAAEITTNRARKALSFLNEIEWVIYPNDTNGVTVLRKRIREDLVSRVLCKEYCETQVGVQTILDEYQD